jgi:hypothetical protein
MTITIKIDTGNAAFSDGNQEAEVIRILSEWVNRIPRGGYDCNLYDYNGNRVGVATVRGK